MALVTGVVGGKNINNLRPLDSAQKTSIIISVSDEPKYLTNFEWAIVIVSTILGIAFSFYGLF